MALVTIIIPMHNSEKTISRCLQSVMQQTLQDIEIICMDDASEDCTIEIVNHYAESDKRIKIVRECKNIGTSLARKKAVELGTGQYYMFVDSDDYYDKELCQEAYDEIIKTSSDIVKFDVLIDGNNVEQDVIEYEQKQINSLSGELIGKDILYKCFNSETYGWILCNKIIKAEIVKDAFAKVSSDFLILGEDAYSYFYIAYYSQKLVAAHFDAKYHYCYGEGGTAGITSISMEKFEKMNKSAVIGSNLRKDICDCEPQISYISKHLLQHIQSIWITAVRKNDRATALSIMLKYWSHDEIAENMAELFFYYKDQNEVVIEENVRLVERLDMILNSKGYKVQDFLWRCIHVFKRER